MGIEPGDISSTTWVHDPNPTPIPETPDNGPPKFLKRDMDDPVFRTVGQKFSYSVVVGGRKPIKVTISEEMFDENKTVKQLEVVNISPGYKGFTFEIQRLRDDMEGEHTFKLEATNNLMSTVVGYVYLFVQGRNSGG